MLKDDVVVVFDIDGVLAPYEFGDLCHSACLDCDWETYVKERRPYASIPAIALMQRFIREKGADSVYACSVAADYEIEGKLQFVVDSYGVAPDHVITVPNKSDKLGALRAIAASRNVSEREVVLVEDTVKTLDSLNAESEITTAHVSSLFAYGEMERADLLTSAFRRRRSVRTYDSAPIPEHLLDRVIEAGLLSASGRGKRPWELIVVRDRETLSRLAHSRKGSALMLENAGAAIVVLGDSVYSDTWVEDCSIVMANMHLMADALGLGSCWIQGRMRNAEDDRTTQEYVFDVVKVPAGTNLRLEAILSLGVCKDHPAPRTVDESAKDKIHYELF